MINKKKVVYYSLIATAIILMLVDIAGAAPYAYITNSGSNTVSIIDTTTNTVTTTVPVGIDPCGVAVTPNGQSVYVANTGSNNVSVIDTATNQVTATVPVGINPHGVAVTPDGQSVYVTNSGNYSGHDNTVSVINTATNTVIATVNVGLHPISFGQFISGPVIPTADFSGSPTIGNGPTTVKFTDKSLGLPTLREWLFGDGGYKASKIPINPVHTYENAGNYNVSLKVKNDWGIDKVEKSKYINVTALPPVAQFSASVTKGFATLNVQFTDKSLYATGWNWSFGDVSTSTQQNPAHNYTNIGRYTVNLTASNIIGTNKSANVLINITQNPIN
jgi:YVTN family beta-propeller protein